MQKPPVASVINFCTNEARFLRACIEQCSLFSSQILIPVCGSFFDGTAENHALLKEIYAAFPNCTFIEYPFAAHKISSKISTAHFWHSVSRAIGYCFLDKSIERVFFLDADEVPDGNRVLAWLDDSDYTQYSVLKLANYWYFREPRYRADQWEDSIVLAHRGSLELSILLQEEERNAIFDLLPHPKKRKVVGSDGRPMFHHFSWVRTKEEMLRKVEKWGHRNDRNWKSLIETEFSSAFAGKDFIHGYSYSECSLPFEISMAPVSFPPLCQGGVTLRLSEDDLIDLLALSPRKWWKKIFSLGKRKFLT